MSDPLGGRGRKRDRTMWRCAVALLLCATVAHANRDRRSEADPVPFVLGSRYGRSPTPERHILPRNDRFFMGSRYGKRADPGLDTGLDPAAGPEPNPLSGHWPPLLCHFSGLYPFFRCTPNNSPRDDVKFRRSEEEEIITSTED